MVSDMNAKAKVWSDDGWDGVYEAAVEKQPHNDIQKAHELVHATYTGDKVIVELMHPNIIENSFNCDLPCRLSPKNGIIEFDEDVKPTLDLNRDGIDDTIEAEVRYLYSVPKMHYKEFDENGDYLFPPANTGPRVVDMRTFTGVVIGHSYNANAGICKMYYQDGKRHRFNGPAIESLDGFFQAYYVNGIRHRTDGPAVVHSKRPELDCDEHYINGKYFTKEEFADFKKGLRNLKKTIHSKWPGSITEAINKAADQEPIKLSQIKPYAGEVHVEVGDVQNDDYIKIKSATDLLKLDQINKDGGSRCQKCNEFNEYVVDPYYICYSCKNL